MPKPPMRAARELNPTKRATPAFEPICIIKAAPALERPALPGSVAKGFKKTKPPSA